MAVPMWWIGTDVVRTIASAASFSVLSMFLPQVIRRTTSSNDHGSGAWSCPVRPERRPSLQPEGTGCRYAVQRGCDRSEPIRAVGPILVGACELRAITRDEIPPHDDLLGERPATEKEHLGSLLEEERKALAIGSEVHELVRRRVDILN